MDLPNDLKYTDSHEWIRAESDGSVTIGITDHAQAALGDLVYLELPAVGRVVATGEACAVVEPVKAASDVYARWPERSSRATTSSPESRAVNENAYAAWRSDPAGRRRRCAEIMDAAAYSKLIAEV